MWTVLVADDSRPMRELVRAMIECPDYRVIEAEDGNEAWDVLQTTRPDVAVLDVDMPCRTGLDLTRAIRSDPELDHMRVILLTGRSEPEDEATGRAAGADRYLTKPCAAKELVAALEACLPHGAGRR